MFQFDSKLEFAAWVNPKILRQQQISFAALFNETRQGYTSDTLARTNINEVPYNSFTDCQQQILAFYAEKANAVEPVGVIFPDSVYETIKNNPGPNVPWNLSYNDWGMDYAIPASKLLTFMDATEVSNGSQVRVVFPTPVTTP